MCDAVRMRGLARGLAWGLARAPAALLTAMLLLLVSACGGDGEERRGSAVEIFPDELGPMFEAVQPDLFSTPGAQPVAWADFDNDGDLDLFVGFRGEPNRLYRDDDGVFVDVAPALGLDDPQETRAAAWGDFDGDGDLDLMVGFRLAEGHPNRLYRNEDAGVAFVDVAPGLGLDLIGNTRQMSWLDYDGDGDLDLFVAFREQPNRMFRNEGSGRAFTDVTKATGLGDPRRTVGVAWFDMDQDGDMDAFVANQNGDSDAVYRNDGGVFTDVAAEWGMDSPGRTEEYGGVGPALADYDRDGDLDLFVANYGPDVLWRNDGGGSFTEVAVGTILGEDYHSTSAAWGDFNNDGWPDLFVVSYLSGIAGVEDYLFQNRRGTFTKVIPDLLQRPGASHGVAWADYDGDGNLDLLLANNDPEGGGHPLYRNVALSEIPSLQLRVVDSAGVYRFPGAEVRVFAAGERGGANSAGAVGREKGRILGTGIVDVGGGYCSQGAAPVHFGIPEGIDEVVVEVTVATSGTRRSFLSAPISLLDHPLGVLEIRLPEGF